MKGPLDHPNLIPECYVDTNLMQYLLDGTVNHQKGCSKVIGTLDKNFSDRFAVGVIDRDREQHQMTGYLSQCTLIGKTEHLRLYKHNNRSQFLITVAPAMDYFVFDNAMEAGVDVTQFGLPGKKKEFKDVAKQDTSNTDFRFRKLFHAMQNHPEIVALKCTIKYLLAKNYAADIKVAKQFFDGSLGVADLSCYIQ